MSIPDDFKSLRIPKDLHARLAALQDDLPGVDSMWKTVEFLMSASCVRVAVSLAQRERWQRAADGTGQNLGDFITSRVEGALMYGADRGSMELMYRHIRDLHHDRFGPGRDAPQGGPRSVGNP